MAFEENFAIICRRPACDSSAARPGDGRPAVCKLPRPVSATLFCRRGSMPTYRWLRAFGLAQ